MNPFNRLLIWQKFTLGFMVVGLFFFGIVLIYHSSIKQVDDNYERLHAVDGAMFAIGNQLSNTLSLMREVEYAFQLNPSDTLSEVHQRHFTDFLSKLKRLTVLEERSGHTEDVQATKAILKQINVYRDAFVATVNAWKVKGFSEKSGLRKQFLEEAERFKTAFNNLDVDDIYISLLRLSEFYAQFQITDKKKYTKKFIRERDSFLFYLNDSKLDAQMKQEITQKLDIFVKTFQSYVLQEPSKRDQNAMKSAIMELSAPIKRNRVRNIWRDYYQVRNFENTYLRTGEQHYADQLAQLIGEIQIKLDASSVPDDVAIVVSLETYRRNFLALVNQDHLIRERNKEMKGATQTIETLVAIHLERVTEDMKEAFVATRSFSRHRTNLAFVMACILIVLMIGIAVILVNSLVHPISKVTNAMLHVADGNMDSQVPVMGNDELGQMATIFNQMASQLSVAHNGLQNEQEKLTTILLSAREGIIGTNRDGKVALVNPAALRLLGKTEEKIVEDGFLKLIDDPDYVSQFLERSGFDMPETVVYNNKVLNFFAASIQDKKGEIVGSAALIRDVTEEKKLERMLRDLSNTDGLTQLLNRRRFDELMQLEYQRARRYGLPLGLLLFDVDHFKKFNDTYGHDQGDRVLQAIANTMKDSFRDVDFCCRYGGEEFCVITPSTTVPGLMIAAERFRERIESMVVDGLKVTVTIGVVAYPIDLPDAKGPAEIFKAADDALYVGKKSGRNKVCAVGSKDS